MTLHSYTKLKYCRTDVLTTHLFCKRALRSSLECEIGTAVEPFHEKNNNVKPTGHKIYQGRYYLLIFFLNIYVLLQSSRCRSNALCLLAQRSVSRANGVSFFWISLRATGWLKNAKIASVSPDNVNFVWNLYTKINYKNRKLILVV